MGVTQKFLLEIKHLHAEPNSEGGKPLGNSNISKSDLLADPCAGDGSGSSGERHSIAEKALTKSVSFLDPCAMLFSEKECHLENFTDSVADISDKLSGEHGHECREEQDEKVSFPFDVTLSFSCRVSCECCFTFGYEAILTYTISSLGDTPDYGTQEQ